MAHGVLDEVRERLGDEEYQSAEGRGSARPYEVAAKELIDAFA